MLYTRLASPAVAVCIDMIHVDTQLANPNPTNPNPNPNRRRLAVCIDTLF